MLLASALLLALDLLLAVAVLLAVALLPAVALFVAVAIRAIFAGVALLLAVHMTRGDDQPNHGMRTWRASTYMVKTQCERELAMFMGVSLMVLLVSPKKSCKHQAKLLHFSHHTDEMAGLL